MYLYLQTYSHSRIIKIEANEIFWEEPDNAYFSFMDYIVFVVSSELGWI